MDYSTPGFPVLRNLPELAQTYVHWVGDAIQQPHSFHPLLLLLSIFPSIRVFFQWVGSSHQITKELEIQLQYQFFQWIFKTHSFRIYLLDLLVFQGSLKSLQHQSRKASILQCSALFMVQFSNPYMATGKTIALTRRTFVGKVMFLLFKMLSRLVIIFLPRSNHLLISWLQLPSAVILEPPQNKVSHCFHCFPIYLPWSDRTRCHDFSFLNVELFFFFNFFMSMYDKTHCNVVK